MYCNLYAIVKSIVTARTRWPKQYGLCLWASFYIFVFLLSMACRNLVSNNMGVKVRIPLQKLHPLSRAIHHRYSNQQVPPHRTAARHISTMSRLPMRPPKPPPGSGGRGHQQQRNFWMLRLAARILRLRYIVLGSAVGGGYTAKKVCLRCWLWDHFAALKVFHSIENSRANLLRNFIFLDDQCQCRFPSDLWGVEGLFAWFQWIQLGHSRLHLGIERTDWSR